MARIGGRTPREYNDLQNRIFRNTHEPVKPPTRAEKRAFEAARKEAKAAKKGNR